MATRRLIGHKPETGWSAIGTLLQDPGRTVHWPLYGPAGVPLEVVLQDVKAPATLVLHHATLEDLRSVAAPDVLDRLERYRTKPLPARARHPQDARYRSAQ